MGRYTLEWFIKKYGEKIGKKKFSERRENLQRRKINYVYDNKLIGKKRGPMSDVIKKRISDRKAKMKMIRPQLHKDILSDTYTIPQLEVKYGISKPTILRERRKLTQ